MSQPTCLGDLRDIMIERTFDYTDIDKSTFNRVKREQQWNGHKVIRVFETTNFGYILLTEAKLLRC